MNGDSLFMLLNKKLKDIKESNKRQENSLTQTSNEIVNVKNSVSGVQTSCDEIKGKFDNIQVDIDPNMIKNAVNDLLYENKLIAQCTPNVIEEYVNILDSKIQIAQTNVEQTLKEFNATASCAYMIQIKGSIACTINIYVNNQLKITSNQDHDSSSDYFLVQANNGEKIKITFSSTTTRSYVNRINYQKIKYVKHMYCKYLNSSSKETVLDTITPNASGYAILVFQKNYSNSFFVDHQKISLTYYNGLYYTLIPITKDKPVTLSYETYGRISCAVMYGTEQIQTSKVIKSIQRGRTLVNIGTTPTTINIAPVKTSRSLVFLDTDFRGAYSNYSSSNDGTRELRLYIKEFTNNSLVIENHSDDSDIDTWVSWQIIEFL